MNTGQGQAPQQQGQAQGGQGHQGQQAGQPQQRPLPMFQPAQIRKLPLLNEDEKNKYEQGLEQLWNKYNNSPADSQEHLGARQKIMEFSRMLTGKMQQRRAQQQAAQAQQAAQSQQGQAQQQQSPQVQAIPQTQVPLPQQPQPSTQSQAQPQQQQPQAQAQPQPQIQTPVPVPIPGAASGANNGGMTEQGGNKPAAAAQGAAASQQRPKLPDSIVAHVNKMSFNPPPEIVNRGPDVVQKWTEDRKDRYGRALYTMESAKKQVNMIDKRVNEKEQAEEPFTDEEREMFKTRRQQQLKMYQEANKWIDSFRKQQVSLMPAQAAQNGNATGTGTQAENKEQQQNMAVPGDAAAQAAKNQQMAAANRQAAANGATAVQPPRPVASVSQPSQAQAQAQGPGVKTEQPQHPTPANTALANGQNAAQAQAQARTQTPQAAAQVSGAGPTRALSHSAALSLANQRANTTPGNAPAQGQQQQPAASTPTGAAAQPQPQPQASTSAPAAAAAGTVNQNALGSAGAQQQQQQQQGLPHAHPTQQQATIQSKMPIPKQLPERATTVPQGVTVGGGVSTGRPTMSQGSGTLGGVMNQPAVNRIPAYNHEAEGDHVLSKKKLDEMVRQVCGGSSENQDGNLLMPEVEESILGMADSFVDNVLHAACRNSKERGSKVLEIRDIQLVLERTYNIRVPGYSSDELRTVRKVQPSAGWIAKMSAVQAAKVMPGKTD